MLVLHLLQELYLLVEMQDQLAKHDAISLSSLIEIELVLSQ